MTAAQKKSFFLKAARQILNKFLYCNLFLCFYGVSYMGAKNIGTLTASLLTAAFLGLGFGGCKLNSHNPAETSGEQVEEGCSRYEDMIAYTENDKLYVVGYHKDLDKGTAIKFSDADTNIKLRYVAAQADLIDRMRGQLDLSGERVADICIEKISPSEEMNDEWHSVYTILEVDPRKASVTGPDGTDYVWELYMHVKANPMDYSSIK